MKTLSEKETQILFSFLEDGDPKIVSMAEEQLRLHFFQASPFLKGALAKASSKLQARVRELMKKFHWEKLETEFRELSARDEKHFDLEDGVFLLARFARPDLEVTRYAKCWTTWRWNSPCVCTARTIPNR